MSAFHNHSSRSGRSALVVVVLVCLIVFVVFGIAGSLGFAFSSGWQKIVNGEYAAMTGSQGAVPIFFTGLSAYGK